MAGIDWLRLWHDMPNDPKWRTVSRASGQPISLVIAMYLHLLVDASQGVTQCHGESRTVTRGVTDVTDEDIASALDVTEDAIRTIREVMQGRVLDGDRLTGWERRQPKREDAGNPETGAKSSAERKREQRERERQARENGAGHDVSRGVTGSPDREEKEKEETEDMSGKPDPIEAKEVIEHLNAATGSSYRPVESNLKLVRDRLKSGATVEQCKAVIDAKVGQWGNDPKMAEYLRPTTLFRASNFEQYLGQLAQQSSANAAEAAIAADGATFIPGVGRCY